MQSSRIQTIKVSNSMFSNILNVMVDADREDSNSYVGSVKMIKGIDRDHGQSYDALVVTR